MRWVMTAVVLLLSCQSMEAVEEEGEMIWADVEFEPDPCWDVCEAESLCFESVDPNWDFDSCLDSCDADPAFASCKASCPSPPTATCDQLLSCEQNYAAP